MLSLRASLSGLRAFRAHLHSRVLVAQAQSLAYGDGFAIVGIVFWAGILPALWMRARH